ncbi:MAG: hypothetical protein PF508_02380 [Spirochaeta sp.]|jgi:hypothetical protein|nr:hypothetical protein [Spirochaeta sp.]
MNTPGREHGPAPWRTAGAAEPERYARRGRACDDGKTGRSGGIFRHNRGLLITLIDLIVVTMLFVIFILVIRPLSDRVTVGGYQADVTVERSNGDLWIRTTVQLRSSLFGGVAVPEDAFQPIVTLSAGGLESVDLAPPGDSPRIIELRIPAERAEDRDELAVTIRIGDEEAVHTVSLR